MTLAQAAIFVIGALVGAPPLNAEPTQDLQKELKALGSAVQSSLPKDSHLLATCGPSEGRAYYLSPKHEGWADDPISIGRTIFTSSGEGDPNILFQDARGGFVNAREDGAVLVFSFLDAEKLEFGIIETYPKTGVTQTYVLSADKNGDKYMLWTTAKAHVSVADITKVSVHVSRCY